MQLEVALVTTLTEVMVDPEEPVPIWAAMQIPIMEKREEQTEVMETVSGAVTVRGPRPAPGDPLQELNTQVVEEAAALAEQRQAGPEGTEAEEKAEMECAPSQAVLKVLSITDQLPEAMVLQTPEAEEAEEVQAFAGEAGSGRMAETAALELCS